MLLAIQFKSADGDLNQCDNNGERVYVTYKFNLPLPEQSKLKDLDQVANQIESAYSLIVRRDKMEQINGQQHNKTS